MEEEDKTGGEKTESRSRIYLRLTSHDDDSLEDQKEAGTLIPGKSRLEIIRLIYSARKKKKEIEDFRSL